MRLKHLSKRRLRSSGLHCRPSLERAPAADVVRAAGPWFGPSDSRSVDPVPATGRRGNDDHHGGER